VRDRRAIAVDLAREASYGGRLGMKKYVGWLALLVVLGLAAFGAWKWQKSRAVPEISYKTQPVEKRRIVARVTASGTLQATVTVQVGAQVSGRIAKLNADFNSTVKKGQLIAKLDPQLFTASTEQARANHLSAKAGVARAEAQERDAELVQKRTKALHEQSLASAAELQTSETAVSVATAQTDVAKAALGQAAAALHQAQVNLSYTDIFSPIDGTVISRNVDVGQTVAASLQAPVLFTIAEDLRKMQVHTSVAEGDVGRLQPGMDASFSVDAFPGQRFRGKVGQIRNAAQTLQNVVTYDAVIDVDNSDLRLRPGMTATVTIVWSQKDDVVAISNAALRFKPPPEAASAMGAPSAAPSARRGPRGAASAEPESRTVWLLRGGRPESVTLQTGLSDGTVSEIAQGDVKPGDEVIVEVLVSGKSASGGAGPAPTGGSPRLGRMF
jgi:HlyD family secretion protein